MPRISRAKSEKRHASAVQLPSKRAFAVSDNEVVESIIPGHQEVQLAGVKTQNAVPSSSKRRRSKLPASALVPDLPLHPYNRTQIRREKRRAKQQLAGGELQTIATALSEAVGEPAEALKARPLTVEEKEARRRKRAEAGKIGEGKGRTLTEPARRKQISLEAKRIPAVMSHPAFKQNPWATIRLHAGNSLSSKEAQATTKGKTTGKRQGDKMEGIE